jgi:hypothetical protein
MGRPLSAVNYEFTYPVSIGFPFHNPLMTYVLRGARGISPQQQRLPET